MWNPSPARQIVLDFFVNAELQREGDGSSAPVRPRLLEVRPLAAGQRQTTQAVRLHKHSNYLLLVCVGLDTRAIALAADATDARIKL